MGKYSVPEEIRKMKPKGTNIKVVDGKYYVYTHEQAKNEETGKWKTLSGHIIGKIDPQVGFISNDENLGISCFDYGEYLLLSSIAGEEFYKLCSFFNRDDALKIFAISCIYVSNNYIGVKAIEDYYEKSLFAHDYPSIKVSYKRISSLLESIGRSDIKDRYQSSLINESEEVAIDGHVITSESDNNNLSSFGFKTAKTGSSYLNFVLALDVNSNMPIAIEAVPGYQMDKASFKDFYEAKFNNFKDKIFLMDAGFYSEDNLSLIASNHNSYVIPASKNYLLYKEVTNKNNKCNNFIYKANGKVDSIEYKEIVKDNKKVIYFKNLSEAAKLDAEYLTHLDNGDKGYSLDRYNELKDEFGVIVLITNLIDKESKEIYYLYKKRWKIETFFERTKNGLHFETFNMESYGLIQGIAFILLITGRIDEKLKLASNKVKMTRNELIRTMSFLKLNTVGGVRISNKKKDHLKIAETLSLEYRVDNRCLDKQISKLEEDRIRKENSSNT